MDAESQKAIAMNEQDVDALWERYLKVWRSVLTQVLEWPDSRVGDYIHSLKQILDASADPSSKIDFFFDTPCSYLVQALLSDGLHERIMNCPSDDANPVLLWQRLVHAITNHPNEQILESADFDWDAARVRYQQERLAIESWLSLQESGRATGGAPQNP